MRRILDYEKAFVNRFLQGRNGGVADSGARPLSLIHISLVGRNYTDLADEEGTFAFTKGSLEGFDSQKAYLDTMKSALTDAVGGDIPEADVYVALTFDDGPTGATDTYPNGYTATLLEELKKRNVHALSLIHI